VTVREILVDWVPAAPITGTGTGRYSAKDRLSLGEARTTWGSPGIFDRDFAFAA